MSVSDNPLPAIASDDIWHQNKAEIRDLYQNRRKTLRDVKHLMELKGFPKKLLSTWETKIRDVLQLRKKAKAPNWPLIYQHVLPRLQQPGQKELRRRTAIYLNGSEIPWDKAWKEIRRSRAISMPLRQKPPSPLPSGIVIRTPSPVPGPSTTTDRASQLMGEVVATYIEHKAQDLILRHESGMEPTAQIAIEVEKSRSVAQYAISVYQDCAATIPWVDLYQALQDLLHGAHATSQLDDDLFQAQRELSTSVTTTRAKQVRTYQLNNNFQSLFGLVPAGCPIPPHPSHDLGCRVAISAERLQLSQFISTAMYLLSNHLHDTLDGDQGLKRFCSILELDTRQAIKLLHRQLPSIRSAWQSLLYHSTMTPLRGTFRLLIDIGIRNNWINLRPMIGEMLFCAVNMDCNDTVMALVNYGCRSGSDWWTGSFKAIVTAIRNDNDECARLLIEHCDFTAHLWWSSNRSWWRPLLSDHLDQFPTFIREIDIQDDGDMRALEFLLTIGADVDQAVPRNYVRTSIEGDYRTQNDGCWRPTILDYCFYFDRPVYWKLAPYSKVSKSDLSRNELLLALENDTNALQHYLATRVTATTSSNWERAQSFLELILAEQFMLQHKDDLMALYQQEPTGPYKGIDMATVRSLVQYGVDLALPSINASTQDLLSAVIRQLCRHCTDDGIELLVMLTQSGASINGAQLRMAVQDHGFNVLECLALLVEDFPAKAVLALAEAARLNKLEAVEFLLRAGLDPDSFVPRGELEDENLKDSSYSVQAIAVGYDYNAKSSSFDMIKLLAEHGARLVVTPNDSSPFDFTRHLLMYSHSDTFHKVKYAVQVLRECNPFLVFPSDLLELCVHPQRLIDHQNSREAEFRGRLEIFESFLDQGAPVQPGSCLAAVIHAGGPDELVEKVVRSGADLNAYHQVRSPVQQRKYTPLQAAAMNGNEHLVHLLLASGSSVNSRACGPGSLTALQAICSWDTATEEEYERKVRICQLLISHGADINAAPARIGGFTALQRAAMAGHLETAVLLLRSGARVNAPPCGNMGNIALDAAVLFRRLDMTKFLLNANALSHFRGTTGYDGAIELAERMGNFPLAHLIREHAGNNMALDLMNPELLKPQEDYRIYGYVTDEEYDIDRYNPEALWEHCTMDSLCRYCSGIAPDQQ